MINEKSKPSKIIYDPFNLSDSKETFILDNVVTQFEFRIWYETLREKGGEILIKSKESFDYFNQFLPDLKARAYVEIYTPSKVFQRKSGINLPEAIDEVISDSLEIQRVQNFLSRRENRKTKYTPSETFNWKFFMVFQIGNLR
ncbi:MAG: hypothetical protein ACUVWJ_05550 [Spirochaetota bacterium]